MNFSRSKRNKKWHIWVDRGGTFTDVVAIDPSEKTHTLKVLSHSHLYEDPVIYAIDRLIGEGAHYADLIEEVRVGTTLATNALLERRGARMALIVTQGFSDVLVIGDQRRKFLFKLDAKSNESPILYDRVIEVEERVEASGQILNPLNEKDLLFHLSELKREKIDQIAISLVNSYLNPQHELKVKSLAESVGFSGIVCGHEISSQINYVNRTRTACIEAYLVPVIKSYVEQLSSKLSGVKLLFMQSQGGLCRPEEFLACNSLLSGPAGGVVGAATLTKQTLKIENSLAFDMGGTSTDISLVTERPRILNHSNIDGVDISTPSVDIDTIAAGGGSILFYENGKMRVGPESAGSRPGPSCYGLGGPLTVTDANLFLNKINQEHFPEVFGRSGKEPLNRSVVVEKFNSWAEEVGVEPERLAEGFLQIATENIVAAIRNKVLSLGVALDSLVLCAFGGAAAQVACQVAEKLGVSRVFIPNYSSVLSALGMGLSQRTSFQIREYFVQFDEATDEGLRRELSDMTRVTSGESECFLELSLEAGESQFRIAFENLAQVEQEFERLFKQQFGYANFSPIAIQRLMVKTTQSTTSNHVPLGGGSNRFGDSRPPLLSDGLTSVVIGSNWKPSVDENGHLQLVVQNRDNITEVKNDAAQLELFNRRFQSIAEQMGLALQQSAQSINVRERLDFSCAIFLGDGRLIANAPHIPVHLGSMQDSVLAVLQEGELEPGDVFLLNSPYNGGTHLPDLTLVTPVFIDEKLAYVVACRAHHADVGGVMPGSMPAHSQCIEEEGVLILPTKICAAGHFLQKELEALLSQGDYPSRNVKLNVADIKAQMAANERGKAQLLELCHSFGRTLVDKYALGIIEFSAQQIKQALHGIEGAARTLLDDGEFVDLKIKKDSTGWVFDFTESSDQLAGNRNTPSAVVKAAVMYCLRCLLDGELPLNAGCIQPIKILTRPGSILDPKFPAAVVAGNVETSQLIVDTVFQALGKTAGSHGTMNNLSFGNAEFQYYETIGGGSGAGVDFDGISAKQIHMTNSKMTDVEVLESRLPVRVDHFMQRWGSGGQGLRNGGDGLSRKWTFQQPVSYSILSGRRVVAPPGLMGGFSGELGRDMLGDRVQTPQFGHLKAGESLTIETPGGGGYGALEGEYELYFAYGSNLFPDQVELRTGACKILQVARLNDYKLAFTRKSLTWGGYAADVIPGMGHGVWGVLYYFSPLQTEKMDRFEGFPDIYQRIKIEVENLSGERVRAFTYVVTQPEIPGGMPSYKYISQILYSARRFNFPQSYLNEIESYRGQYEK